MSKKAKRKYKRKTEFAQPDPDPISSDVDLMDVEDVNETEPERMTMGGPVDGELDTMMNEDTSDLLVILAVLVHHLGINAVEPTPEQVAKVQAHCAELGHNIDADTLVEAFKKAQIALLRRQLD